MGRRRTEIVLDVATGVLLAAAAAVAIRSHLLPALGDRGIPGEGERLDPPPALETLAEGRPVRPGQGLPALYLVYRSSCPACRSALPAWRRLLEELPARVRRYAVALEPAATGIPYARAHLAPALPVRPAAGERFAGRLGIRVVPATIYLDGDGRLRFRHEGVPGSAEVERLLRASRGER